MQGNHDKEDPALGSSRSAMCVSDTPRPSLLSSMTHQCHHHASRASPLATCSQVRTLRQLGPTQELLLLL
jgi:hypothetical protein